MHASQDPHLKSLLENGQLEYRHAAVEDLNASSAASEVGAPAVNKEEFDIVFAMEVVEHVADPQGFLRCLADIVKVHISSTFMLVFAMMTECLRSVIV